MPRAPSDSLLEPFRGSGFRYLWLAWLSGNMTMWMHEVTAAWRMTQLTESPVWVAWVQAAGTLPLFVLGLASGALADLLNRRRFLAVAQAWIAVVAAVLAVLAGSDALTPGTLLLLCLLNGVGLAFRFPVFSALVPDLVERRLLSSALTLNALAINLTRVLGPIVAGIVLAWQGSAMVFALNAVLSILAGVLIWRAPIPPHTPPAQRTRLLQAMRDGVGHARASPILRAVLFRAFVFFAQAVALVALLPLVAKGLGANEATYTALLAAMGAGAVLAAMALPRLPAMAARNRIIDAGVWLHALATLGAVWAPSAWTLAPALALSGAVWLCVANTLTMSAQLVLPTNLRARGMAIYQMSIMGGSAGGAIVWGVVAEHTSVNSALVVSAVFSVLLLLWTRGTSVEERLPH
ncbi:MAG: MFS transporter [Hydrogenophaga sp.]|nr:MFS transporter [Hydrogenophaga sp.]